MNHERVVNQFRASSTKTSEHFGRSARPDRPRRHVFANQRSRPDDRFFPNHDSIEYCGSESNPRSRANLDGSGTPWKSLIEKGRPIAIRMGNEADSARNDNVVLNPDPICQVKKDTIA